MGTFFIRQSCDVFGTRNGKEYLVAERCPRSAVGEVMASAVKAGFVRLRFVDNPPELAGDEDDPNAEFDPDREF